MCERDFSSPSDMSRVPFNGLSKASCFFPECTKAASYPDFAFSSGGACYGVVVSVAVAAALPDIWTRKPGDSMVFASATADSIPPVKVIFVLSIRGVFDFIAFIQKINNKFNHTI